MKKKMKREKVVVDCVEGRRRWRWPEMGDLSPEIAGGGWPEEGRGWLSLLERKKKKKRMRRKRKKGKEIEKEKGVMMWM